MAAHALIGSVHNRPRGDWRRVGNVGSDEHRDIEENREPRHFFVMGEEGGKVRAVNMNSTQFFILQVIFCCSGTMSPAY